VAPSLRHFADWSEIRRAKPFSKLAAKHGQCQLLRPSCNATVTSPNGLGVLEELRNSGDRFSRAAWRQGLLEIGRFSWGQRSLPINLPADPAAAELELPGPWGPVQLRQIQARAWRAFNGPGINLVQPACGRCGF